MHSGLQGHEWDRHPLLRYCTKPKSNFTWVPPAANVVNSCRFAFLSVPLDRSGQKSFTFPWGISSVPGQFTLSASQSSSIRAPRTFHFPISYAYPIYNELLLILETRWDPRLISSSSSERTWVSKEKSQFGQSEIHFLGRALSYGGKSLLQTYCRTFKTFPGQQIRDK